MAALTRTSMVDEQAVARVFEELRPKLEAFAWVRGLVYEAEDVVHETLLAALSALREGRFRGESTLQTWIYGILRKKISEEHRVQFREAQHLLPAGLDSHASFAAVTRAQDADFVFLVNEVLDSLPARHWLAARGESW